jgi:hypothetical protein
MEGFAKEIMVLKEMHVFVDKDNWLVFQYKCFLQIVSRLVAAKRLICIWKVVGRGRPLIPKGEPSAL